jgi:hypothetical protein
MKSKTHFAFRIDIWDDTGNSIVEHVAGVDDFEVAEATYRAAILRWPKARITLRQGIRVVERRRTAPGKQREGLAGVMHSLGLADCLRHPVTTSAVKRPPGRTSRCTG